MKFPHAGAHAFRAVDNICQLHKGVSITVPAGGLTPQPLPRVDHLSHVAGNSALSSRVGSRASFCIFPHAFAHDSPATASMTRLRAGRAKGLSSWTTAWIAATSFFFKPAAICMA